MPPTKVSGRPPGADARRRAQQARLKLIALLLWVLVLALMPFYYFPSGRPQISDYVLALLSLVVLIAGRRAMDSRFRPTARALTQFVAYVVVINSAWWLAVGDNSFLLVSVFYLFNLLVFAGALMLFSSYRREFLDVSYYVLTASVLLQAVLGFLVGGSMRGTIYFNTPNQLAYYALGATTIAVILSQQRRGSRIYLGAVVVAGMYLQYIAISRAGALSMAALLGAIFVRRPAALLAGGVLLGTVMFLVDLEPQRLELWELRVATTEGESLSDHIQERGVDRIVDNPKHLLVGAGEGAYRRFSRFGLELHSSLLTVLFCYGIVGLVLFGRLLWRVWKRTGARLGVYLVPMILFGVTHQGLRFRIFWLSFVVCMAVAVAGVDQRKGGTTPARGAA